MIVERLQMQFFPFDESKLGLLPGLLRKIQSFVARSGDDYVAVFKLPDMFGPQEIL